MKKTIILLSTIVANYTGFAQDQLFKKDNTKLEVKILEINQTEIKYKLFNYQDGPTVIISKNDVALIIYQTGVSEVIKSTEPPKVIQNNGYTYNAQENLKNIEQAKLDAFKEVTSTKNLISINSLDFLNGALTTSYLREFGNNMAHVYVPISVGFTNPPFTQLVSSSYLYNNNGVDNFRIERKSFEAGVGVNIHTSGKRKVTHFVGPYIGIAQFNGTFDTYNTNTGIGYNPNPFTNHGFVLNRYYFMLNNGILFRVTKNFNMMLNIAVGVKQDDFVANNPRKFTNSNNFNYNYNPLGLNAFKFGLHFGYRF